MDIDDRKLVAWINPTDGSTPILTVDSVTNNTRISSHGSSIVFDKSFTLPPIDGTPIGSTTPSTGAFTTLNNWSPAFGALLSNSGAPLSGGTGYAAGDIITLAGGTFTTAAQVTVDAVSVGVITKYHAIIQGVYSSPPSVATQGSTTGTGTGATFGLSFGPIAAAVSYQVLANFEGGEVVIGGLAGTGRKGAPLGNTIIGFGSGGSGLNNADKMGGGTGMATTASECTLVGYNTGTQVTSGNWLTYLGHHAGGHETTGASQVLIGTDAGKWIVSGNNLVGVGVDAGKFLQNPQWVVAVGDNTTPGGQFVSNVTGAANNGSGIVRLTVVSTTGMVTGDTAAVSGVLGTTEANGYWPNVTVVDATHIDLTGSTFAHTYTSGGSAQVFGSTALQNVVSVGYNTLSSSALRSAGRLIAVGTNGLDSVSTGFDITAVGHNVGTGVTTGNKLVLLGSSAGNNIVAGTNAVIIGFQANTTADVGQSVIVGASSFGGAQSVVIGQAAGNSGLTGTKNVIIGQGVASVTLKTGTGNILIGVSNSCDTAAAATANTLLIQGSGATAAITGTALSTTPLIGFPGASLAIGVIGTAPTVTSGAGAPSATQPNGSIYLRTDGAANTRLYVSEGGGTWAAITSA